MKKVLIFAMLSLAVISAVGQSIVVTFTGRNQNGAYHPFTSVSVQNQTRGWSQTLTYPDTTLILNISQGIADVDRQLSGLSTVVPNPFVGTATATLSLAEAERVSIEVVRINGQRIVEKNMDLPAGSHQIGLSLAETQVAFLVVKTPTQRYVSKLANKGNGGSNAIRLLGSTENISQSKAVAEGNFQVGDMMSYVGLSSDGTSAVVAKAQQANELITLIFTEEVPTVYLPTVSTVSASDITTNSATSGGNVTDDGNATVTARGVCWSTSHNPTVSGNHTTDGSGIGGFTSSITGLTANTTYYIRAYATNSQGTAYGAEKTFTTADEEFLATVSTSTVSNVTTNTATCGGSVTDDGNAIVTARGVCWSTAHNPTISGSHTTDGSDTGSFTSSITGLSANTTYYVRAYATNSQGTAYGAERSFITEEESVADGFDANGASNALFSVSDTKQVKFSKGNLQYQASSGTWRFAENQYDYIGDDNENVSSTYSGWIDAFGWGTSGWNSGANAYQPWSTNSASSDYYLGGNQDNNLTGTVYANADWGVYNAISNGGNQAGMWRTLTKDEWSYLVFTRSVTYRYVKATVNGIEGLIVFPDSFTLPSSVALTGYNTTNILATTNQYDQNSWNILQSAGCIFLPAAGYRMYSNTEMYSVGSAGYYWSSSYSRDNHSCASCFKFWGGSVNYPGNVEMSQASRGCGLPVRLVQDAN